MRSSLSKGLVAIGVMAGYFAGCGGSSVRHGTPDDGKGPGGTVASGASGGATGTGAGRNGGTGAQGGTDVAVGAGGGPTRAGRGGGGGKGGVVGKGGTSGTAGSTSGSAGAPDPECDCTVDSEFGDFSCRSSEVHVPSVFADPAQCEVLDARVKRQYCDDGSTHYTFIVGEENEYRLEVNSEGEANYFSADGYVKPLCGEGEYGSVTQGTSANSECFDACALCEAYDDLPTCLECVPDADDPYSVSVPLPAYCEQEYCPATVTEAREHLTGTCNDFNSGEIHVGCGLVTVDRTFGLSETRYVFNQQSGTLVGISLQDDIPFGLCSAWSYRVGNVPDAPCSEVATCTFCSQGAGEAGAPGAAGAAGAANTSLCDP